MGNIGWKRHLSQLIQDFFKDTIKFKFYNTTAKICMTYNFTSKLITKFNDIT